MSKSANIILPAKLENLDAMVGFIGEGAENQGFVQKTIHQIHLACEEALVNVIHYAYPDGNGDIELTYDLNEEKGFVIEIIDRGVPFDPLSLPEPDIGASIEDRKIGGLGVYMMRNIMDEVRYKREGDRNILALIKHEHYMRTDTSNEEKNEEN